MRKASHPHSSTVAKDFFLANASVTANNDQPELAASAFGEIIGFDGPDCKGEWFDFACVGNDPKSSGGLSAPKL